MAVAASARSARYVIVQLDTAQLAARARTDAATVRRLSRLGILPAEGELDEALVPRVHLSVQLERAGVSLEALARAIADSDLSADFVDRAFLRPIGMLDTTYRGLAEQLGVSERFAEAVQISLGVGQTTNVASRLMDYGRPGEVLVTAAVAETADREGLNFTQIGSVSLKGVASLVDVFSASTEVLVARADRAAGSRRSGVATPPEREP